MVIDNAQHLASLIRLQFGLPDLLPLSYRLLADGEPVSVAKLAGAGGWDPAEVRPELDRHPGLDWDDRGRLLGFGLTLRPTPHRFRFEGRDVYAFCASDALLFPVLLEKSGVIESSCPATDRLIRVEVTQDAVISVDPASAVVSRIRPDHAVADLRAEVCALGNFFRSREAAASWLDKNPDGTVVPITEDFATTRQAAVELGWTAPSQHGAVGANEAG